MRIRSIKPEYFTHPEIVPLSIAARLLFISLWTQVDDEGRIYDQPRKIAANAFGDRDKVNPDKLMEELAAAGRVNRYEADGKPCLQVVHFSRHQRIDKPRPSVIPPGPLGEESPILPGIVVETSRPDLEVELEGRGKRNGSMGRRTEPSANGQGVTERAALKNAIVTACGWALKDLTPSAWGRVESAAKGLHTIDADPDDLILEAEAWRQKHPDIPVTPQVLEMHFAEWAAGGLAVRRKGRP